MSLMIAHKEEKVNKEDAFILHVCEKNVNMAYVITSKKYMQTKK